ncbi:hypothetical protein RBY4I_1228 [Rhodobacterales bacterium Y4I]|nr:hypothetical protein RBY4I_1228 [Rhodobacterales bacterium Y4I]
MGTPLLTWFHEAGCLRATRTCRVRSTHPDRPVQAGTAEDLAEGGLVMQSRGRRLTPGGCEAPSRFARGKPSV